MKNLLEVAFKVFVVVGFAVIIFLLVDSRKSIAYVDALKLVNGYKGMQAARKEFEAKVTGWQSNLDTLKVELEAKIKDYETNSKKMPPKERAMLEDLIQTQRDQFVKYQHVVSEKIQKEDQDLTSKVLGKVNDYIRKYGAEHRYEIIMAATQSGNIVYGNDGSDITDEVLEGLNND